MKVDLDGEFGVAATADETFAFITDPERFAPILPYFKKLTVAQDRKFTVVLEVGVPQIRGTAEVDAELVEEQAPQRAVYSVKGRHTLGMMDSTMTFSIAAATPSGSKVTWRTESVVSGTLVSLAQGILLPLAKRQIRSLAASVGEVLGSTDAAASPRPSSMPARGATSLRGLFGRTGRAEANPGDKQPRNNHE
jgi:carbon monoxide dehydrogenase subunit G